MGNKSKRKQLIMKRNYYVCSVGDPNAGTNYDTQNLMRCIVNCCFVINEGAKQIALLDDIKIGDILILKYKNEFIAYGSASSPRINKDLGGGWNNVIEMNTWIVGKHAGKYGIQKAREEGGAQSAIKKINRDFALSKIEEIGLTV